MVTDKILSPTKFSKFIEHISNTSATISFSGAVLIYLINVMTKLMETEI